MTRDDFLDAFLNTDEILKAATPRPWQQVYTSVEDGEMACGSDANDTLALIAVNSYEKQREALLRVIDSPGERDKWLTEVYAAAGVERPATANEYSQRQPLSTYERQRECLRHMRYALIDCLQHSNRLSVPTIERAEAAIAEVEELLK